MAAEERNESNAFLAWLGWAFALFALYWLFAGESSITEGIGGTVAVLSAIGMRAIARLGQGRPNAPVIVPAHALIAIPLSMARDSWAVGASRNRVRD